MSENKKTVYRLAPVPAYDVEGMESWLTDLAAEGLFLSKDGFFCGVGYFHRDTPRKVAYRLAASEKQRSAWDDNNGEPDEEAVALSEALGWEYVAARGQFFIYRSQEPMARELNTDPRVQAIALKQVKRRCFSAMSLSVFYVLLYLAAWWKGQLLLACLQAGTAMVVSGFVIITLLLFVDDVLCFRYLNRLHKRLRSGEEPDHRRGWRRGAYRRQGAAIVLRTAFIVWVCVLALNALNEDARHNKTALSDYTGELPFATLADYAGGAGEYREVLTSINGVYDWSDPLAPRMISWAESAEVVTADGTVSGGLYVDYYETRFDWMAREVARELIANAKRGKYYEELPVPPLGVEVDYAAAYYDIGSTLVLRKGNVVVQVNFSYGPDTSAPDGPETAPLEEWASIAAEATFGE